MIDGKEYAKQMRENAVIDDNGNIIVCEELWQQIANIVEKQQAEIDRLTKYNTDVASKHYNDGIKEFAKKLKEKAKPFLAADILGTDDVDNLVKEMVGEEDE